MFVIYLSYPGVELQVVNVRLSLMINDEAQVFIY